MKIDIARQPLVPAFVTLFALAVTAMWGGAGDGVSADAPETMPLLGGALTRFQAAYPVWARLAAGFMILFTGMCTGRIAIRYNLYGVSTCLPIPLYAVVACGIFSGGNYLTAFAASMLLALAAKNYCRSYCNGYGFDAIFRASLYLGLLPLVYAPATPLVLILPLAILLFKRTFREAVVAAAGLILPLLTACYVSWGMGDEFTAPVMTLADALVSGVPLWIFKGLPLPSLVMLCVIAALALTAVDVLRGRGWAISAETAFAGIASARWPGRFEVVDTAPLTIVDGGHNPQGAEALAASLADLLGEEGRASVDFALGVLADKDYPAMVRAVAPWARSFSVYAPKSPRALAVDELAACVREIMVEEGRADDVPVRTCGAPADALRAARDAAGPEGCVVAFGTLYAIADLMGAL